MLTSIATVSVSGTLESKLHAIAAANFDGVEIFENDLLTAHSSAREIGKLIRNLGLRCMLFQPFRDFEGMPDNLRPRIIDRLERKFELMQELGTELLLMCSNVSPAALPDRPRIVADLQEMGERAARHGLRVGYEALAWGRHIWDHRQAWSLVQETNHPSVGLILDSFHSLAREIPIDSLRSIDPARIFFVQLADATRMELDLLSWSRHFRTLPGQGDLPLVQYVSTLLEQGYSGPFSLEIFNDRFRSAPAGATAVDGRRALSFLEDQVAHKLAPRINVQLAPRVHCNGVEFIEFATNEEETKPLCELFASLGFTLTSRHRSRDVTRWHQNGVNFIVSCEADGFARAYESLHGTSVCAVGLSIRDVESALQRAHGLQIQCFPAQSGPGELELPSIRGMGGSLIYLVESGSENHMWDTEFTPVIAKPCTPTAGIQRVDHIAQTMSYEEMFSWQLYYLSLLDLSKTATVQIADPLGLVQSQALQTPDGSLRLTLNSSSSDQTLAARFLQSYHGAGVQHIALTTTDIMETARRLKRLGLCILPIPRNYYDDLEARFGLDDRLVRQLAELNILYDRDADGEYFQLYSRAFAKRFFFEIVERRGYRGFGATNAVIRLAAQSRFRDDVGR